MALSRKRAGPALKLELKGTSQGSEITGNHCLEALTALSEGGPQPCLAAGVNDNELVPLARAGRQTANYHFL